MNVKSLMKMNQLIRNTLTKPVFMRHQGTSNVQVSHRRAFHMEGTGLQAAMAIPAR